MIMEPLKGHDEKKNGNSWWVPRNFVVGIKKFLMGTTKFVVGTNNFVLGKIKGEIHADFFCN